VLKNLYLALCIPGAALPLWQFVPWVRVHGLDARLFVAELFANRISSFFAMDVIVSAAVVIVFALSEKQLRHRWAPIAATLLVGGSLGLPLLLYLRERRR
jgi:hypothetical protein